MFRKRKDVPQANWQDKKLRELNRTRLIEWKTLEDKVREVIVKNAVIDLYPVGADKEKAKEDAEQAKKVMLASIANYDAAYQNYNNFWQENKDDFVECSGYLRCVITSHNIVEMVYRHFYQTR